MRHAFGNPGRPAPVRGLAHRMGAPKSRPILSKPVLMTVELGTPAGKTPAAEYQAEDPMNTEISRHLDDVGISRTLRMPSEAIKGLGVIVPSPVMQRRERA